jgi:hypothetical protein
MLRDGDGPLLLFTIGAPGAPIPARPQGPAEPSEVQRDARAATPRNRPCPLDGPPPAAGKGEVGTQRPLCRRRMHQLPGTTPLRLGPGVPAATPLAGPLLGLGEGLWLPQGRDRKPGSLHRPRSPRGETWGQSPRGAPGPAPPRPAPPRSRPRRFPVGNLRSGARPGGFGWAGAPPSVACGPLRSGTRLRPHTRGWGLATRKRRPWLPSRSHGRLRKA